MYLPARFNNKNLDEAKKLVNENPFATVISLKDNSPFVSHLPLVLEQVENQIFLYGHLARANPHSQLLAHQSTYVIFHGAHSYITPIWYEKNDVPTWNYAVVHMQGQCEMVEDYEGILDCIRKLSEHVEKDNLVKWQFWVPEDLAAPGFLERNIVGFKFKVADIQAKFKLNQNRAKADQHGVIKGLIKKGDDMSLQMAELMKKNNL